MNFTDYNRYIITFSEEEVMEALMDLVKKHKPTLDLPAGPTARLSLSSGLYYNAGKSATLEWFEERT
jgi:hypothetical protein